METSSPSKISWNSVADAANQEVDRPAKVARMESTMATLRPPTLVGAPMHEVTDEAREAELTSGGRIYEYSKAADPVMAPMPHTTLPATHHLTGPTRAIPFDLSGSLQTPYAATSPFLLVGFLRIVGGETLETEARATSQTFYVIRGKGESASSDHGVISWAAGDMVVLPKCDGPVIHAAAAGHDCSLYFANDEPLLKYLGVEPVKRTHKATVIRREAMLKEVEAISHEPGAKHRNRMGILLGNKVTDYRDEASASGGGAARQPYEAQPPTPTENGAASRGGAASSSGGGVPGSSGTLTLTPMLWSLLNVLPPKDNQRPHRHQSVALDLCVYAKPGAAIYTMMGPELDPVTGTVKDGIRMDWASGAVFTTPPGWWHSHHNHSDEPAWVLPMQDAGLLTYGRNLDIRFSTGPAPVDPVTGKSLSETAAAASSSSAAAEVRPVSPENSA